MRCLIIFIAIVLVSCADKHDYPNTKTTLESANVEYYYPFFSLNTFSIKSKVFITYNFKVVNTSGDTLKPGIYSNIICKFNEDWVKMKPLIRGNIKGKEYLAPGDSVFVEMCTKKEAFSIQSEIKSIESKISKKAGLIIDKMSFYQKDSVSGISKSPNFNIIMSRKYNNEKITPVDM